MADRRDNIDLNSYSTGKKRRARRKGKKGFAYWWSRLKKPQKAIFIASLSVVLCIVIAVAAAVGYISSVLGRIDRDDTFSSLTNSDLGFTDTINENIFNIALFGVDSRKVGNYSGLSDSIMILSVDKLNNDIKLVSIMRDSFVPIEGKNGKTRYGKINSAYSTGGPQLAVKTLNQLFSLDIANYATVNFYGMSDIIEAVGGIEAEITDSELHVKRFNINDMIYEQCQYMGLDAKDYYISETGMQHLNGVQAVAYSRIRHAKNFNGVNDDFGRTDRQRYVMQQLLEKALKMDVTSYPALVNKLLPYVKTSLSNDQLLSLAYFLSKKPAMIQARIPHDDFIINANYKVNGDSTVYYNYKYAGKVINALFYEELLPEEYMKLNGIDKTGWHDGTGTVSSTPAASSGTPSKTSSASPSHTSSSSPTSSSAQASSAASSAESKPDTSSKTPSKEPDEPEDPAAPSKPDGSDTSSEPSTTEP